MPPRLVLCGTVRFVSPTIVWAGGSVSRGEGGSTLTICQRSAQGGREIVPREQQVELN